MDLFSSVLALLLLCAPPPLWGSILPEGPLDAVLGRNVTITTTLSSSSYTVMIWGYSDGEDSTNVATVTAAGSKVNGPYLGRVSVNTTNGFLSLGPLRSADSGDYSINVVTADGTTLTGEVKLRVLEPVSEVRISSSVPEAVEFNSSVLLTCTAKGSFLTFTWLNGSAAIQEDKKRIFIEQEEASSQLSITSVLRSDLVGPLYCRVANKLETERSSAFNLTVHYGPEEVKIHPAKPNQFIRARSGFNLTCTATSSPPPQFSWFYNQQRTQVGGAVLRLADIETLGYGKKEGTYHCEATNYKTGRTARSPPVSFGVLEPISGVKVSGPSGVLLAGNSSANLSCTAAAGSVKTRAWLKNGVALSAGPRVRFSADMTSVFIGPLDKDDNAKFSCRLSNAVNAEEDAFAMTVSYGPETPAVQGKEAVEVEDPVTLTCSAPSVPPANYTWKFNGTLTAVKTPTFSIAKALYSSSGVYTCEAHNAVTGKRSSSTHTLSVKEELVEGLSDGAIAGIVIAVLVALVAAVALVFYCRQKVPVDSPY